jgi:hypothetical protein
VLDKLKLEARGRLGDVDGGRSSDHLRTTVCPGYVTVSSLTQPPESNVTLLLPRHPSTPILTSTPCRYDYLRPVMDNFESSGPDRSSSRMSRRWARKCERYCCLGATYFPLAFVYSITSWAVWVEATIGFLAKSRVGKISDILSRFAG